MLEFLAEIVNDMALLAGLSGAAARGAACAGVVEVAKT